MRYEKRWLKFQEFKRRIESEADGHPADIKALLRMYNTGRGNDYHVSKDWQTEELGIFSSGYMYERWGGASHYTTSASPYPYKYPPVKPTKECAPCELPQVLVKSEPIEAWVINVASANIFNGLP